MEDGGGEEENMDVPIVKVFFFFKSCCMNKCFLFVIRSGNIRDNSVVFLKITALALIRIYDILKKKTGFKS